MNEQTQKPSMCQAAGKEPDVYNWTFGRRGVKGKYKGVSQREVLWELFVAFHTHILPHMHSELFRHWNSWRVSSGPAVAPDFSIRLMSEALRDTRVKPSWSLQNRRWCCCHWHVPLRFFSSEKKASGSKEKERRETKRKGTGRKVTAK